MAKQVFGEFAAFETRGGIRFSKNNKMISENAVPPEVVAFLKNKLASQPQDAAQPEPPTPQAKFPMPSEEEKQRLREESLKVPDGLKLTPEEEAQRAVTGVPDNEAPLQPDDFETGEPLPADQVLTPEQALAEVPVEVPPLTANPGSGVDPSFLESVSIHTAPLEAIAQALYDRFGVYTIWLNMLPQPDEVNPLTGEPFTKYHQGIAYQAAIAAHSRGLQNPENFRRSMDEGRSVDALATLTPPPTTLGEARRQDDFAFRTSAQGTRPAAATQIQHVTGEDGQLHAVQVPVDVQDHGGVAGSRYDADEDEQVLEPPIFGTKPIIKPNW